jgi:hypothetical protein
MHTASRSKNIDHLVQSQNYVGPVQKQTPSYQQPVLVMAFKITMKNGHLVFNNNHLSIISENCEFDFRPWQRDSLAEYLRSLTFGLPT